MTQQRTKILVGVTGSVAAIKVPELVTLLLDRGCEVRVIFTTHGSSFLKDSERADLASRGVTMYTDETEWSAWSQKGDPVLHIELRKWCDLFLICPLDANTLAKVSNGICDNLLTSVVRAWEIPKPLVVCPAMNTAMWVNPFTERQLNVLREIYSARIVPPKEMHALACGDIGPGALADIGHIVGSIFSP
jgi:phosphopantothenoylcysteine decarboxylase